MKKLALISLAVVIVAVVLVAPVVAQQISGDYIETRSADVYTGQCFANGEVGLTGNEAILGWRVQRGSWNGVALDGLSIAAAVRAKATLGDPYENPYPAKAVLIVDELATPARYVRRDFDCIARSNENSVEAFVDASGFALNLMGE